MILLYLQLQQLLHCIKYASIRVFTEPHYPVQEQNLRFRPYAGSVKIWNRAYFMQWWMKHIIIRTRIVHGFVFQYKRNNSFNGL